MVQEVYADLYVMVNAGMDLLCLMLTALLTRRSVRRGRLILGALLGGGYALAALLLGAGGLWGICLDVLIAFLMCWVAFGHRGEGIAPLLRATVAQILASAFLGGIMTALYAWLNRLELPLDALGQDGASVWIFAVLAALSGLFTAKGGRWFGRSHRIRAVTLEAVLFGRHVTLRAMVDTGNLLKDPISGRGVIVADRRKLEGVLPRVFPKEGAADLPPELARLVRLIPTGTALGHGMLTAIVPDSLTVVDGGTRQSSDLLIAPAVLEGWREDFDALIPWD